MPTKKELVTRRESPAPPQPPQPRGTPPRTHRPGQLSPPHQGGAYGPASGRSIGLSEAVAFESSPFEGAEHRQFPRARMAVRFDTWIGEGTDRRFQASFTSDNV